MTAQAIDLYSADFIRDPYPAYRRLREEFPVYRHDNGLIFVSRYAEVQRVLGDASCVRRLPDARSPLSNDIATASDAEAVINRWLVFLDPPRHTAVRRAMQRYFTPAALAGLLADIERQVVKMVDEALQQESVDIIAALAYPLPIRVIAGLLGIPDADYAQFQSWAAELTVVIDDGDPALFESTSPTINAMRDYFAALLREGRMDGGMIESMRDAHDGLLDGEDVLASCIFLLWAGHETTKVLLSNGLLLLVRHPEQMSMLRDSPALLERAVEECLRYESPLQKLPRWTTAPLELAGETIEAGRMVVCLVGAANRDPAQFDRPDAFDCRRDSNRHLALGYGIHHCLGAALARAEARIALQVLLDKTRDITAEDADPAWRPLAAFRSLAHYRVRLRPA